jgi:hypothetical protein
VGELGGVRGREMAASIPEVERASHPDRHSQLTRIIAGFGRRMLGRWDKKT